MLHLMHDAPPWRVFRYYFANALRNYTRRYCCFSCRFSRSIKRNVSAGCSAKQLWLENSEKIQRFSLVSCMPSIYPSTSVTAMLDNTLRRYRELHCMCPRKIPKDLKKRTSRGRSRNFSNPGDPEQVDISLDHLI